MPELLPSSSVEAATATVCRVSWNYDDTPGHEFQALVIFRSKEDVIQELDWVLSAAKDRKEVKQQESDNGEERLDAINELNHIISAEIGRICAAFGLDENQIEDIDRTAESILADHHAIANLLGTTQSIYFSDAEKFAVDVKPYLDSTPTPWGITAWPLIEEVRLYIRSDILKYGLVLVDLPGLSDTVEARSAIAERYFQKLAVTTIVTPAVRAVDEKTGVKLMGSHQELRLKLDGKYHRDSLCVVISKIDDIDCDAFCAGFRDARQDSQLQADTAEIKSISKRCKETRKQLKRAENQMETVTRRCRKFEDKLNRLRPAASVGRGARGSK